jgi:hypothetical protein
MAKKTSSQLSYGAFAPGQVRVLSRSLIENHPGRSVATVTVETLDGLVHSFKTDLDDQARTVLKSEVERLLGGHIS